MSFTQALLSGIVQGLTEFLPVSSSGHLVLLHKFFGFAESNVFFDICLHAATLLAVILYFRKDIAALIQGKNIKWLLYITFATIPAVAAALLFEKGILVFFADLKKTAFMLILTGVILFIGQLCLWKRKNAGKGLTMSSSLFVGIAQAFALFPGISRSGITISAGLLGGTKKEEAFKFSFLLLIPVVSGAMIYKLITLDISGIISGEWLKYTAGMFAAFITGFLSLYFLWSIIRIKRLFIFGIYCIFLGIAVLTFWK